MLGPDHLDLDFMCCLIAKPPNVGVHVRRPGVGTADMDEQEWPCASFAQTS